MAAQQARVQRIERSLKRLGFRLRKVGRSFHITDGVGAFAVNTKQGMSLAEIEVWIGDFIRPRGGSGGERRKVARGQESSCCRRHGAEGASGSQSGARTLKSIDVTKVDADSALNIKASIDALDRIEKAFAKARTDAELISAMHLAMTLSDSFAEDSTTVKLVH